MTTKKAKPEPTADATAEAGDRNGTGKAAKAPRRGRTGNAGQTAGRGKKATVAPAGGTGKARKAGKTKEPRKGRTDTKQAKLIGMLRAPDGSTIAEIVGAFGWQPHTARGAIAGALKKKLGLNVVSEKTDRGRVYRIPD